MFDIITTALILGFVLSFSLGPVFFELINTSFRKGFKAAMLMEVGVLLSDLIYLFLALFSASKALEYLNKYSWINYIFGAIFILFGIFSIIKNLKPPKLDFNDCDEECQDEEEDEILDNLESLNIPDGIKVNYIGNLMKGVALNSLNPSVLVFWIVVCTSSIKKLHLDNQGIIIFFSATLGMMFAVDVLKIYFASRLQKYIKPKVLQVIGISIGLIMLGVGLYILFVGFEIPQEEFLDETIEIANEITDRQ
jgi:threonine/homoserine/homoserine lactone efflux protein